MPSLGDTIGRLAARRSAFLQGGSARAGGDTLVDLDSFGRNPGALRARCFVPANLGEHAALVVVLHGCTQTAADYDRGAGWSALAQEAGFAVLFAEQQRSNNANLCFTWFAPGDIERGGGEVQSIAQMTEAMVVAHGLDRRRIFVTGLSAGGAMAMAMLATHPEVYAGGAVIAGVPYAAAATVAEAFDRMRGHGLPDTATLAARMLAAAPETKALPILSVWQGSADATVDPANAEALVAAWCALHDTPPIAAEHQTMGRHQTRSWRDAAGRAIVESHVIAGMGHGTPLATHGHEACGVAGPYMLDVGVSSTRRIAAFWGISAVVAPAAGPRAPVNPVDASAHGVSGVITRALQQAGLMP